MKPKLNSKQIYRIVGGTGLILFLYMSFVLNSERAWIVGAITVWSLFMGFRR